MNANPPKKSDPLVDPSTYTEFSDEDHTVLCEWWDKDRKLKGWFKAEDLRVIQGGPQ